MVDNFFVPLRTVFLMRQRSDVPNDKSPPLGSGPIQFAFVTMSDLVLSSARRLRNSGAISHVSNDAVTKSDTALEMRHSQAIGFVAQAKP